MKMGVVLFVNNAGDNTRFSTLEDGDGQPVGDGMDNYTYASEIEYGDSIEQLGFDAIWTVEHHFSPYTMVPDPLQFLSFWAGRTKRVGVGTMVVVLPWHDPVRVAEQIVLLEHLMGDERDIMIGFGRGLGRREYGGLRVPMAESRERFEENFKIVRGLIENERFNYQGQFNTVPDGIQRPSQDISIRPRPRNARKLLDNFYVAWGSPQSVQHTGHLGLKPLIIPQRAFSDYLVELEEFNTLRGTVGLEPANSTICLYLHCAENDAEIEEGKHYLAQQNESAALNYEFGNDTISKLPSYSYYSETAMQRLDVNALPEFQLSGTPDTIRAYIQDVVDTLHPDQLIAVFKQGGMPLEKAQKSLELFSREVLPFVHELVPQAPIVQAQAIS